MTAIIKKYSGQNSENSGQNLKQFKLGVFLFLREDLVSEHEPLAKFIDDNRLLT